MVKVWAQPLRRRLFVAFLILLAPMLAVAAALGVEEYRQTVGELQDQTQATAVRTASAIERELVGLDRMAATGRPTLRSRRWTPRRSSRS